MATVKDLYHALRDVGPVELGLRVYRQITKDNVFTNAAAMAYAWVFAVFPMMIFLMSLVPYLPKRFRDATPDYIADLMYGSGMTYAIVGPVQETAKSLLTETHGGLLSFGLVLTLYAASGGMNTTMAALDTALDIQDGRSFFIKRLMAMLLTIVLGVSFVIVMVLLPLGNAMTELLASYTHLLPNFLQEWVTTKTVIFSTIVRYVIGLTIMQLMIGVLYQFGPSRRQRVRFFTPGSIFTALGWIATGIALRFYFENFNTYSKTYGTVAGMVIMLMVFYLDAAIILVGAELDNEVMKARYEKPSVPEGPAAV